MKGFKDMMVVYIWFLYGAVCFDALGFLGMLIGSIFFLSGYVGALLLQREYIQEEEKRFSQKSQKTQDLNSSTYR